MSDFITFSASNVPLKETNLIEASAGTGKTYSIAIMVLRLLLEQNITIRQVLMVTFTKAAVAELEERIRLFVKQAYKASQGEAIRDQLIAELVQKAMLSDNGVQQKLQAAVLFLDELSVLTIHSFCQQTLTEFAFETQQLFGAETMHDANAVLLEEINKFWRQYITTLPTELLQMLLQFGLSRHTLQAIVKEHLNGKKYFLYQADKVYDFCSADQQKLVAELRVAKTHEQALQQQLHAYVQTHSDRFRDMAAKNTYAKKANLHTFADVAGLVKYVEENQSKKYIQALYADVLQQCDGCKAAMQQVNEQLVQAINDINCQAINVVEEGLHQYKQRNNLLSFEDMIVNLHKALVGRPSERLINELRRKYKAVFVDEFQDTDRLQYEIFETAFGAETVMFLIGDPKQSIYAWRKADIFTYFKAKSKVQHRYSMNQNFRSSEPLITAMNQFFLPAPGFDTFYFQGDEDAIEYHAVGSPAPNTKGALHFNDCPAIPITVTEVARKPEIVEAVLAHIVQLLSDTRFKIKKNNVEVAISPSDIGILVRSNTEAATIKRALSQYCIPAVTINDSKVLTSAEAVSVLYLLEAIADTSRAGINKALLSPFTGYGTNDILALDSNATLALFRKYRSRWFNDGVYTALMDFITDFNVRAYLLHPQTLNGERIIANLFQLIELVHKAQVSKQLSPLELLSWLQRGIEGMDNDGDEFEQRIESDEDSIKIVTIHKSKGLEYKIVFAPYLDFVEHQKIEQFSFREPLTGQYLSIEKSKMSDVQRGLVKLQNEQENRRLVYVAVTRAIYKCYLYHCTNNYYKESTLSVFVNQLAGTKSDHIQFTDAPVVNQRYRYRTEAGYQPPKVHTPVQFNLAQNSWIKMSYTLLASKHDAVFRPRSMPQLHTYNQFIFSQLPRGAKTGNLLHYIFENVQFNNPQNWPFVINDALRQYLPMQAEPFAPLLLQMLHETFSATIQINDLSFNLSGVVKRINELEFDFPVASFNPYALTSLTGNGIDVRIALNETVEGVMNGKMDLFFEHNNKFYVLDWKSNYLGDQAVDYALPSLANAMNENNYHLQYLLYTLAATKYLQNRLPGFDYDTHFGGVIYCFVRGMRAGSTAGIYTNRVLLQQLKMLDEILDSEPV